MFRSHRRGCVRSCNKSSNPEQVVIHVNQFQLTKCKCVAAALVYSRQLRIHLRPYGTLGVKKHL